jgi:hypothetical protein
VGISLSFFVYIVTCNTLALAVMQRAVIWWEAPGLSEHGFVDVLCYWGVLGRLKSIKI